jgi:exopolysaccharide production protein ExoZ
MQKNLSIQSLRGYAAILVVMDHALLSLRRFGVLPQKMEYVAADLGAMGVHIFFVISGFIMMYIAYGNFGKSSAPQRFFAARIKRIVPLYYIATALAIGISTVGAETPYRWSDILLSMLFMPSHAHPGSNEFLYPILAVGWTLNYEMLFYVLFAVALLFRRRIGVSFMTCTLLFLIAAGRELRMVAQRPLGTSLLFDTLHYFTRDIMLYFVFGILIAFFARDKKCPTLSIPVPALWGCGLGVAEICVCNYLIPNQHPAWRTASTMIIAIVSVGLCVVAAQNGQNRLSEKLGDASYSIYLFHGFFQAAVASLWLRWAGGSYLGEMSCAFFFGVGGGYLAYIAIERPLIATLQRKPSVHPVKVETELVSVETA